MLIKSVKTGKILPGESIFDILDTYITKLTENTIVAIASKIISISENHLINKNQDKFLLIRRESQQYFKSPNKCRNFCLTLKNHRLIPNAGIDDSNCQYFYVLLPKNPQQTTKKIWTHLRKKYRVKNLGIIITDSNITPLRTGVTGITIGWCGFKPVYSYVGEKDIFGTRLKVTQINLLDSLATIATLNMGEGKEQTPISIINNPPSTVFFQNRAPTKKEEIQTYIDPQKDLFSSMKVY
jgi:putative folate metabolism gamma-glutamate ligase